MILLVHQQRSLKGKTIMIPMGTKYNSKHGKISRIATVTDYHVTTNLAGEIVNRRYVSTHDFMGQAITERDITETEIRRNLIELA